MLRPNHALVPVLLVLSGCAAVRAPAPAPVPEPRPESVRPTEVPAAPGAPEVVPASAPPPAPKPVVPVGLPDRSRTLPLLPRSGREEIHHTRPPVDNQLEGDASWANLVTGRDRRYPKGWTGQTVEEELTGPELSLVEYEGPLRTPFHGPANQQEVV